MYLSEQKTCSLKYITPATPTEAYVMDGDRISSLVALITIYNGFTKLQMIKGFQASNLKLRIYMDQYIKYWGLSRCDSFLAGRKWDLQ